MDANIIEASTYDRIIALLEASEARFELIDHAPEGRTDLASALRGNPLQAAAKAMVMKVKCKTGPVYALVVVPGDRKVDMDRVARLMSGRSASFALPAVATELTDCEMGSVPPFVFDDRLTLIVDKDLAAEERIYFNAGRLDRSLAIGREDYLRAAQPRIASVAT